MSAEGVGPHRGELAREADATGACDHERDAADVGSASQEISTNQPLEPRRDEGPVRVPYDGENRRAPRPDDSLVIAHDPYHPRAEQLRMLRTELILRHEQRGRANIVAVLSPCSGEGRSQLAAELAVTFAQLGQPTLLVDADLRRPRQHVLFGADNRVGLSQALTYDQPVIPSAVEGVPHLSLLPSGPTPKNPLELLSDARFEQLIGEWRERYSYVVIDTAPISLYSDGLAVATLVGRVLAVSRANHTPYRQTREMLRRLAATHSRILGAVISRF